MIIWGIIGIICILYGICVKAARSGTGFFLVWIGLGVVFELLGACAYFHIWTQLPKALHRIIIACIVAGAVLFAAVEGLVLSAFHAAWEPDLDYIIVLGAQLRDSGPSRVLQYRLDCAIEYLKENPDTKCIVSGGQGENEKRPEAEGMADYLMEHGISEDRIVLEDKSMNTVQNIQNSMQYLNAGTDFVGIVTNNFHIFRSVHIAKKQGISHVSGIPAESNVVYLPNNLFREFFGVAKDFLQGNI